VSQENVELVRAGLEAYNRRDFDAALAHAHDSISLWLLISVETDVLRGKQEIRAAWERQVEAIDVHIDVVELTPLDETRVLCVGKWMGRGPGSGVSVEQTAVQVYTFKDGLIYSIELYASKAEALKAVGLEA
jgi:hypothetical protein